MGFRAGLMYFHPKRSTSRYKSVLKPWLWSSRVKLSIPVYKALQRFTILYQTLLDDTSNDYFAVEKWVAQPKIWSTDLPLRYMTSRSLFSFNLASPCPKETWKRDGEAFICCQRSQYLPRSRKVLGASDSTFFWCALLSNLNNFSDEKWQKLSQCFWSCVLVRLSVPKTHSSI